MKKILIIEDDTILQRMYYTLLTNAGFKVRVEENGRKGLSSLTEETPDLILLDIMLSDRMNGFDVLEKLQRGESTKDIKVLILTNLDSEERTAKEIGAVDYLVKVKTKPEEVIARIKDILKN